MGATQAGRYCNRCGGRLARDNAGDQCAACSRTGTDALLKPPAVPAGFWETDQIRDALATRHMGRVFYAYRTHPFHGRPLSQELVGSWLGLAQAQLSRIENGRAPEELTKLIRYAQILNIPPNLLWFALPDASPDRSPAGPLPGAFTLPAIVNGRPVLLPIDRATASATGLDELLADLTADHDQRADGRGTAGAVTVRTPNALTALDLDEMEHVAAALNDAHRFLDDTVVGYFGGQLNRAKAADGNLGPVKALPFVLGILGAIQQHIADVKPPVRRGLLAVAAEGAEFTGWLYRDLRDPSAAGYWYDRAMEWAQAANDTGMQGYVLLKKSQMAYEERDAQRVATLADAAQHGPWQLPRNVRAEVTQQEARGMAMLGEPLADVERKLDQAKELFTTAGHDDQPQFGTYFTADAILLREASCYVEAGKPARAARLFHNAITAGGLSRRDEGYFRARRAFACALSGEPDDAASEGLAALSIAATVKSERTTRELQRTAKVLTPWGTRPGPRQLREALRT